MTVATETKEENGALDANTAEAMFAAGVHYGYGRATRHPSTSPFIYGLKAGTEIIDLRATQQKLRQAQEFAKQVGADGGQLLFVSSKHEAGEAIKRCAESVGQPYVTGRWIGGTLTNFKNIRSRVKKLEDLEAQRDSGEMEERYTNKEQILLEREIDRLDRKFGGTRDMGDKPAALYVVDAKQEEIAVREARKNDIPIISLSSTDCDISDIAYPIPGNDSSRASIEMITEAIRDAYAAGKQQAKKKSKKDSAEE